MIHAYIPLVIGVALVYSCRKSFLIRLFGLCLCLMMLLFISCVSNLSMDTIRRVPFIGVSDGVNVEVPRDGVFYIVEGGNSQLGTAFIVTDGVSESDISNYISKTLKPVYIFVKSGIDVVYSKNMGYLTSKDTQLILDLYDSWRISGSLPSVTVRYKFLIFYFDI